MNEEIQKLEEEKKELIEKSQVLEQSKNELFTRIVEIQGVIKFLQEKKQEKDKENK